MTRICSGTVWLSAARRRRTSANSCGAEIARAPHLKIPALCQAMFSTTGPSHATRSTVRGDHGRHGEVDHVRGVVLAVVVVLASMTAASPPSLMYLKA